MHDATPSAADALAATLARALGAQYELKQLVGRGGMGAVYLAREPFLERNVAVKVLTTELASGEARERFLREARTAARLSHPHIVPLHTFGQAETLLYYVMGYVDGESLEKRLERDGRLPPDEVRRIVIELADALDYAHESGVVHRDVKPDNVLIDRATGRAMLTDFGVAKHWARSETLTVSGVIVGTPQYMSPEQASGERDLDGRSDVYALGVMAYRMATGRLPFAGGTFREILAQHATRAPVPAVQIEPSLPLDLDSAITKALAKDPSDRWRSAREMSAALAQDGEESLPEEMQALKLEVQAPIVIFWGITGLTYAGILGGYFTPLEGLAVWAGIGVLGTILVTAGILIPPARRFGWHQVLRQVIRQPRWWSPWWPPAWRHAEDVWHRLPSTVRRARVALGVFLAISVPVFLGMLAGASQSVRTDEAIPLFAYIFAAAVLPLGAIWETLTWWAERHGKLAGLSKVEAKRLLSEPTWNLAFWGKPHIAALLQDAPEEATAPGRGREPSDLAREIERLASQGAASPHADVYRDAAESARAILLAVSQCDRELAQLARDADPHERERIHASLDSLGPPGTPESPARAQMRELLERQMQLFRDLAARQEEMNELRSHLHEQLRTLALQLARLRSDDLDAASSSEITERIRLLIREIEYRVQAAEEVRRLIQPE